MVCGNICVMTSSPTPEQIAKMDADQLQAMLLGQIKANSVLQVEALELRASNINLQAVNAELQVVVKYKDAVISKITLELALHKRFRFSKKAESLTVEQRHLFDETIDGDTAQIEQEELDKLPEQDKEVVTYWNEARERVLHDISTKRARIEKAGASPYQVEKAMEELDDKLLELREKLAKCQEAFRLESKLGDLLKRQNDKKALFERLKLEVQRLDSESKVEFPASIVQFRTS